MKILGKTVKEIVLGNQQVVADIDPISSNREEQRKRNVIEDRIRAASTKVAPKLIEQAAKEMMDSFDAYIGDRIITDAEFKDFIEVEARRSKSLSVIAALR